MVTEDAIRAFFGMFRDAIRDKDMPEIKKFVDNFIQRVVVYRSHVEVTFRIQVPGATNDALEIQRETTREKLIRAQA